MKSPKLTFTRPHFSLTQWWLIVLALVCAATIFVATHAIMLFVDASRADAVSVDIGEGVESISRETLRETITVFEARIRRFEGLMTRYEATSDPSI